MFLELRFFFQKFYANAPPGVFWLKQEIMTQVYYFSVPGLGGSQLEAKFNKTKVVSSWCEKVQTTYFTIWVNILELLPMLGPSIDCFVDNTKLVYDNVTRTTKNTAGVDIRVPGWGSTETVELLDPSMHLVIYFKDITDALVTIGYVRNISLRGAPYDFRKAASKFN